MRKLIALAVIVLAVPASAQAQEVLGEQTRAPQISTIEWLIKSKEEFDATPEQVAKLAQLSARFDSATAELREDIRKVRMQMMTTADRQATMQKMKPLRAELEQKDEAVVEEALKLLSDDQKKTVAELVATRRSNMDNRGRAGNAIRPKL